MIFRFERFLADDADFRLIAEGAPVYLEPKALRLLLYLIQNRGRLVRKQELLDAVWSDTAVSESVLTRSIGLLRKALNDDPREPRFIETVPTAGYRFIAHVETAPTTEPLSLPSVTPTALSPAPQPSPSPLPLPPHCDPGRVPGRPCLRLAPRHSSPHRSDPLPCGPPTE